MILLSESLEDLNIRKEVCDSIKDLSSSMSRSIELLAQSLAQPPQRKPRQMSGSYTTSLMNNLYRPNFEQSFN